MEKPNLLIKSNYGSTLMRAKEEKSNTESPDSVASNPIDRDIYGGDSYAEQCRNVFLYKNPINADFLQTEAFKKLFADANTSLEFEHRRITLEEGRDEVRFIINLLEASNQDGKETLAPLKIVKMQKSQTIDEVLNKALFKKRILQLHDLAKRTPTPFKDSSSFSEKMTLVGMSIFSKVTKNIADEIGKHSGECFLILCGIEDQSDQEMKEPRINKILEQHAPIEQAFKRFIEKHDDLQYEQTLEKQNPEELKKKRSGINQELTHFIALLKSSYEVL